MKFFAAILLLVTLGVSGCATSKRHDLASQMHEVHIAKFSRVPLTTVRQIADARGGKEDGEIWLIDRSRGDIRIRKTWPADPRKKDTEFWHLDQDGSWAIRH